MSRLSAPGAADGGNHRRATRIGVDELASRWSRLRDVLDERGLDAAVVRGIGQCPEMMYLTGAWVQAGDAYFLLDRDGGSELVVRGGSSSGLGDRVAGETIKVTREQPGPSPLPERVAEWLRAHGAKRVGFGGDLTGAALWATALHQEHRFETRSIAADVGALRYVKSEAELAILRESAKLADEVWENVADFVGVGRSPRQIVGDIQHYLVSHGCDVPIAAYHGSLVVILMPNPPLDWFSLSEPLRPGDYFSLEVSPRIEGYYSQLTGIVSIGGADPELRRGNDAIVEARRASLEHIRAGENATTSARAMLDVLRGHGYTSSDGNVGHLLGLDITEPRVGKDSFVFEEGMTLVAHPMLRSDHAQMLLSGETYRVGTGAPHRLNTTWFDSVLEL